MVDERGDDMNEAQEALNQMLISDGWKIIDTFINKRMDDHKGRLMHCKTWEDVKENQDKYRAYESIFIHIKTVMKEE